MPVGLGKLGLSQNASLVFEFGLFLGQSDAKLEFYVNCTKHQSAFTKEVLGIHHLRIIDVTSSPVELDHSLRQHFNDKEIVPACVWGEASIAGNKMHCSSPQRERKVLKSFQAVAAIMGGTDREYKCSSERRGDRI